MRAAFHPLAVALAVTLAAAPPALPPAPLGETPGDAARAVTVVVNAAGPASLSRAEVSRAFLKSGGALVAVDQGKGARVRDAFSRAFLGRPASAVATHWQQQIFSGRDVPPPERGSDAEVLAFVRAHRNAIGYVSAGAELGAGVRAVAVR